MDDSEASNKNDLFEEVKMKHVLFSEYDIEKIKV